MSAHARTDDPVRSYYRWMAAIYDATRWLFLFDRTRIIRYLNLNPGDFVLEIGAGTGHNLPALVRAVGPGGTVTGLDFSPDMLGKARRRTRRSGWQNVGLVCADATQFSLNRAYQAILFSYSLSMIPNRNRALDLAIGHLVPGGRLGILDFGTFAGWGPLGRPARRWLALNRVATRADELRAIESRVSRLEVHSRRGGYNFIVIATR